MGGDRVQVEAKSSSALTPGFKPEESSFLKQRYQDQVEAETETNSTTIEKQLSTSGQSTSNPPPLDPPPLSHSFGRISVLPIQTKLTIGQPNDKYEQEADRVAEQVMRMPDPRSPSAAITRPAISPVVQRLCTECDEKLQRQPLEEGEDEEKMMQPKRIAGLTTPIIQRQGIKSEEEEEEALQMKPLASQITPLIQRQAESPEKEDEEIVQTKPVSHSFGRVSVLPVQRQAESLEEEEKEEETLQPKPTPGQNPIVSPNLQARITNLQGGGQPLPQASRAHFESRFGTDFSPVRLHTDRRAVDTARDISARAFTLGRNIVFGASQYQPESTEGKRLLAHELTHVVQQTGTKPLDQQAQSDEPPDTTTPQPAEPNSIQRVCAECEEELQQQPVEEKQEEMLQTKAMPGDLSEITPEIKSATSQEFTEADELTNSLSSVSPSIQRQPETVSPGSAPVTTATEPTTENTAEETAAPALIVEDEADTVETGQMKKTEFLNELRTAVCSTAEEALAGTDQTTDGCPYLEYWFNYYRNKDSQHVERAIHKYAPDTARATTAKDYIAPITARVRRAVTTWAETGEITGVPEGISLAGGAGGLLSGIAGAASRVASGAGKLLSGIGNLLFKGREGGARTADNPQAIQAQLGDGRSLEGGVRSRMESAFDTDFSNVRVHTDANASGVSSSLNARAFTVGENVAFGAGEYQPGTPVGDALIAHELAHVVQQEGADPIYASMPVLENQQNALEKDADKSALKAIASLWNGTKRAIGDISKNIKPTLTSGLALQRCSKDRVDIPQEYLRGETLTEEEEEKLDRLEGLHHVYSTYDDYRSLSESQRSTSAMGLALARGGGVLGGGGLAGTSIGMQPTVNRARERAESAAQAEGFENLEEFIQATQSFEEVFQRYALRTAFAMLEENERLVEAELQRYGSSLSGDSFRDLQSIINSIRPLVVEANEIDRVIRESTAMLAGSAGMPVSPTESPRAKELRGQAREQLLGAALRFPVLADSSLNLSRLVNAADEGSLRQLFRGTATDRLEDIDESRQNLARNPESVWKLERVVDRSRQGLGIIEGSVYDAIIQDKKSEIRISDTIKNLILAGFAIGITIATAGAAAPIAIAGAATGAAVSIYQAAEHVEEFQAQQAAVGTAFDRARALSANEPSLFWLAVDIIGAVVDVTGVARAGTTALRAARTAESSLFRSLSANQELRPVLEAVSAGTATDEQIRTLRQVVQSTAESQGVQNAARVADNVADSAADRARRLATDAASSIRQQLPDLSDIEVAGLARIRQSTRAALTSRFGNQLDILRRVGQAADESPELARALEILHEGLASKSGAFETVVEYYMLLRRAESRNLLRAIAQSGVTADDIRRIAGSMGRVRTSGGIITKFQRGGRGAPGIHEAIAEAITRRAQQAGDASGGIQNLLRVTDELNPSQSGSIFEHWATQNIYQPLGGMGRWSRATSTLPGNYQTTRITTDNLAGNPSGWTIVDYKHLREAGLFSGHQLDQLENYSEMLRRGVTHNGRPFTRVEYLFSTRTAAERNAATIRGELGNNVTIYFIDPANGSRTVLQ